MKQIYRPPQIVEERYLEVEALACNKTPGQGFGNLTYCGTVFIGRSGPRQCSFNPNSRST